MKRAGAGAALVLALASGCRCDRDLAPAITTSASAADARAAAPKKLPPLTAASWRIEVPVEGFGPASVSVPLGATTPRPVLVALHGTGDRPEWQCGTWRGISGARSFVLCPRGVPYAAGGAEQRFTFQDPSSTERELRAALRALKLRFGEYVAPGSIVLAGFSLGAIHALPILKQEPAFFSRIALVEGGAEAYSAGLAGVFARAGGKRALFVCAQAACRERAQIAVRFTQRAGAEARLVDAGNLGHVFDGRVASAMKQDFRWLVEGDARWNDSE